MSDSSQPHGLHAAYQAPPSWDFPGKSTEVGCHCLLWQWNITEPLKTRKSVICYSMNEPWIIMLNEVSQSQKGRYCMIRLVWGIYSNQLIETKYCGGCWDWRRRKDERNSLFHSRRVSVTQDENVLDIHFITMCIQLTIVYCTLINCWKWKWSRSVMSWLFATLWTVVYQAPQSMEFSKQEYWSGLPFPSPGGLPNPEIEP